MAINERLIDTKVEATPPADGVEQGLILHLDANDVDSYDGDGSVWYDIKDHEYIPATNADEHFNTVLYTGNGTTNSVTNVGFQPDLIWLKNRDTTNNHIIVDSLRGANNYLIPHSTDADGTTNSYIDSITSTGFTFDGTNGTVNKLNNNYVAWCFKAGGAAVSNTDGTITSQVSANNDLGFSIVKWTGDGSTTTIGHGLDVTPEIVIRKPLDRTSAWAFDTTAIDGSFDYLFLNTTAAKANHVLSRPTSTVFSTSGTNYNANNEEHIAYCFASKRGVSKVGSYTGTGAAGNKVYTGFEPAWVMVKRTDSESSWYMLDNKRDTTNPTQSLLYANIANAETTLSGGFDFNGDNFTINDIGATNQNGARYIYLAFAKNTKETSLIPDTDLELHLDADSFPEYGEVGYSNTPSTWTDISGNGYNSTISNAEFDSELGNWLDFNGSNSFVTVPSSTITPINPTLSFSISLWVRQDDLAGNQTYVAKYGGSISLQSFIFGLDDATNKMRLIEATGSGFNIRLSNSTITSNSWTHIVVTSTSSAVKFYINGTLDATRTRSQTRVTGGSQDITIGSRPSSVQPFDGQIGQTRIYSSALTEDEVRQNYLFTKNKYPNGYNGTLTNMSSSDWNPSGYFNFDGSSDYIQTDLTISSGSVTTSIWFNADIAGAGKVINYFQNNGGRIDIEILGTYSNSATVSGQVIKVNCTTATSQWNHLAIVYTGWANSYSVGAYGSAITAKVYLNDSLVATVSPTPYGQTTGMRIGRSGGGYYYDGKVSKVKVFDKELTSSEITALYNEGE